MATTHLGRSQNRWHFTKGADPEDLDFDFTVDVPGQPEWQRAEFSRLAESLCGEPRLIIRSDAVLSKRRTVIQMLVHLPDSGNAHSALLRNAWVARGPFTLTTPWDTMTVYFDPSQGSLREQEQGTTRVFTVGLLEV